MESATIVVVSVGGEPTKSDPEFDASICFVFVFVLNLTKKNT